MTAPISGISIPSFPSLPTVGGVDPLGGTTGTGDTTAAGGTSGSDFASVLADSLDQLQSTQSTADNLAQQAATGSLQDVSDYMIASNEASLATQTVVTLKNQAVNAFNQIMGMPV